ncbi:hypothetical protein Tco_0936902 [Tanacetum coccineum]|uniref:MAK10-like protein n=1 Tax=Tanacetum coccineum TaxID=301880 RepID=A0ABQ5DFD4_9ASTR
MREDSPVAGDGVTSIKRRRHDQSSDDARIMVMASGHGQLKDDLESSTWRRRQEHKATPSRRESYPYPWRLLQPSHEGYRNTIELLVGNNVVPLRSDTIRLVQNGCSFHGLRSEDPNQHLKDFLKLVDSLDLDGENRERTRLRLFQFSLRDQASNWLERLPVRSHTWEDLNYSMSMLKFYIHREGLRTIDQSAGGKLRGLNVEESWALLEDLALYDNESWNDLSGPHDTRYCMEYPEQAFVEYASSRTDEARKGLVSNFMASQDARLSKFKADFKQQQSEMTNKIDTVLKVITDRIAGALPSDTVKNPKLSTSPVLSAPTPKTAEQIENEEEREGPNQNTIFDSFNTTRSNHYAFITEKVLKFNLFGLVPPSSNTELICTKEEDGDIMFIEIGPKDDDSRKEELEAGEQEVEHFDMFPTRSELAYHKYLMCGPICNIRQFLEF